MKSIKVRMDNVKTSPKKLNILLKHIRRQSANSALRSLKFMKKSAAIVLHKLIKSAASGAEYNYGLDINRLMISQATVGRSIVLKRLDIKGRGRAGTIRKQRSHIFIQLTEEN